MPHDMSGVASTASNTGTPIKAGALANSRSESQECFEISPLMLFPETQGQFTVYLKVEGKMVLYADGLKGFTEDHQHRLYDFGVDRVYVRSEERQSYQRYVEDNLGRILENDKISVEERADVFYSASLSLIQESYEQKLSGSLQSEHFNRITGLVEESLGFLRRGGSLKAVSGLISHDYYTYNHCVNVFVLTAALLNTYDYKHKDRTQFCLGAILHDLGKSMISLAIINKPGKLDPLERMIIETHPVKGAAMCTQLPLSSEALNIILFHHERLDGSGYPAGMVRSDIPTPLRIVALVDVYDALTSDRPYARQRTPVDALSLIREEMGRQLDMDIFKRLVHILSETEIT